MKDNPAENSKPGCNDCEGESMKPDTWMSKQKDLWFAWNAAETVLLVNNVTAFDNADVCALLYFVSRCNFYFQPADSLFRSRVMHVVQETGVSREQLLRYLSTVTADSSLVYGRFNWCPNAYKVLLHDERFRKLALVKRVISGLKLGVGEVDWFHHLAGMDPEAAWEKTRRYISSPSLQLEDVIQELIHLQNNATDDIKIVATRWAKGKQEAVPNWFGNRTAALAKTMRNHAARTLAAP